MCVSDEVINSAEQGYYSLFTLDKRCEKIYEMKIFPGITVGLSLGKCSYIK